ncbi:MAG: hypothetical protein N2439_05230, partial [Anaerolineae bacterium]|nr:hypothetical protein [Anaerolineae bacterium]
MPSTRLTLADVLPFLERRVDELALCQIADPRHPDYGALVAPEYGMTWGQLDAGFITGCAYRLLAAHALGEEPRIAAAHALLPAALRAAEALLRSQRASGLLDLITVNYDSSPDTGFTVQQLCTVIELGRSTAADDPHWSALLARIEQFIRRAVPGLMDGGFHTPNHRWVIASALAQAGRLFPDLDVRRTVDAYLAEGIDLDAEGFFIERSVGVYDAVNDRSLLLIAENYGWPGAPEAVER